MPPKGAPTPEPPAPTLTVEPPAPEPARPARSEAELLVGGPGASLPAPEPAPSPEPAAPEPAAARASTPAESDSAAELAALRRELAELRALALRQVAQPAPAAAPEPPKPALPPKPDPALLLTDPATYQAQYDAYRDAVEAQRIERLREEYRAERERERTEAERQSAWRAEVSAFYDRHPDLDTPEARPYANAVYQELYQTDPTFRALPVRDALDRAAAETKRRLLALRQGARAAGERPSPPRLESSRPAGPAGPAPTPEKPSTMSDAIRALQRRRRELARGRPAAAGPGVRAV